MPFFINTNNFVNSSKRRRKRKLARAKQKAELAAKHVAETGQSPNIDFQPFTPYSYPSNLISNFTKPAYINDTNIQSTQPAYLPINDANSTTSAFVTLLILFLILYFNRPHVGGGNDDDDILEKILEEIPNLHKLIELLSSLSEDKRIEEIAIWANNIKNLEISPDLEENLSKFIDNKQIPDEEYTELVHDLNGQLKQEISEYVETIGGRKSRKSKSRKSKKSKSRKSRNY